MPSTAISPADSRNYLGVGKQTVKGTGVAPTYFMAYVEQIDFGHNVAIRPVRDAGGGQYIARQVKDIYAPASRGALPIRADIGAAMMAYLLGADSVAGGADPYTHTITPANSPAVWLSLERNIADDLIERVVDAMVVEVELDYRKRDSGPELMEMVSFQGLAPVRQVSAATDSYESRRPFIRSDCTWTIDSAAATNVESARIRLGWRVDEAIMADNVTRSSLVKLHLTGEIEVTQLWESSAEFDAYVETHYGTPAGTTASETVMRGDITIDAKYQEVVADDRQFQVAIPEVDWGNAVLTEPDPDASEAVRITRTGQMLANPGGDAVTVTAKNDISAAYI